MTTSMTTTNTQTNAATPGFWKRLWQSIRRLFKREKAGCCASTSAGTPAAQENKAAA